MPVKFIGFQDDLNQLHRAFGLLDKTTTAIRAAPTRLSAAPFTIHAEPTNVAVCAC